MMCYQNRTSPSAIDRFLFFYHDAAPGIDGVTWQSYGENLEEKLKVLHDRVHRFSYPSRFGQAELHTEGRWLKKRPLSIWCLEDKIVQQAVGRVLEAIYEEDFVGFSYGFRPGRGQHDTLDVLHAGIYRRRVNWVPTGYLGLLRCDGPLFDLRLLEHRIADRRILRLVAKWLKSALSEDGRETRGSVVPRKVR